VKSLLRRRPTPALVIALLALFISLSGVSYGVATGFIDSREIKNNEIRSLDIRDNQVRSRDIRNNEVRGIDIRNSTIQSRDLAINAVRGEDVKEDTLAKVPSALLADSATAADAVGGVTMRKIAYSAEHTATPGSFTEVLNLGGLRLEARCNNPETLQVRANPEAANSELSWVFHDPGATDPYGFDLDFDPGDNTLVVDDLPPGPGLISFAGSDGRVVTVHAQPVQDLNGVRGTTDDCGFFGVAEAG
jgi:hypothetical protein